VNISGCIYFITNILAVFNCQFIVWCVVERTASTMMQRMSDMLTRWLEGAVQRAENEAEAEADDSQDQSDSNEHSNEHESPSASEQAESSSAVEERLEASVQDVANLRLSPPSPVDDAAAQLASEVVNDVLCSASREVREDASLSDGAMHCQPADSKPTVTNSMSAESDNLAVSSDNDAIVTIVDSQPDPQVAGNRDSEAGGTLQLKPENDVSDAGCTSTNSDVDGADCSERVDSSVSADVSTRTPAQSPCDQMTVDSEEKTEACHTVNVEQSPPSRG